MKTVPLLHKGYSWESLIDIERDIEDSLDELDLPGEFNGTIRVTVTYEPGND